MEQYAIKQLSVFMENRKGELADVTSVLTEEGISIKSLLLLDSADFGILRLILKKADTARKVLIDSGFTVKENRVFAVKAVDETGNFHHIARVLSDNGINILYTYLFRDENLGAFVFKVNRSEFNRAIELMLKENHEVLENDYFS